MPKLYASLGLILLLGVAFWYHGKQQYQSGVNAERTKWQDIALDAAKKRAKAENRVIDERPVWNERKEKAREVSADCNLPDVHIGVLRESGIFAAPSR